MTDVSRLRELIAKEVADAHVGHVVIYRESVILPLAEALALPGLLDEVERTNVPKPVEAWAEEDGLVLWWRLPVSEPPWVGTPLCEDWAPDYYTHWTHLPSSLNGGRP